MKNYFDIFSLEVKTNIDLTELEKKYLQFQKQFHPDNSSTSDIEKSILLNEAFEVLKNPLRRASYILQLQGINLENDSQAPRVDKQTLLEVLQMREKISESTFEEIEILKKDLNLKVKLLIEETAKKIENRDLDAAAQILIKAKYFDKTLQDLKRKK